MQTKDSLCRFAPAIADRTWTDVTTVVRANFNITDIARNVALRTNRKCTVVQLEVVFDELFREIGIREGG